MDRAPFDYRSITPLLFIKEIRAKSWKSSLVLSYAYTKLALLTSLGKPLKTALYSRFILRRWENRISPGEWKHSSVFAKYLEQEIECTTNTCLRIWLSVLKNCAEGRQVTGKMRCSHPRHSLTWLTGKNLRRVSSLIH